MEVTVLGKRLRSSVDDVPALSTRSKRRSIRTAENDENAKPIDENETLDDFLSAQKPPTRNSTRTAPAKHGAPERRVAISPAKINGHFKPTKASVEVYQDEKCLRTPTTPRHRDALAKKVPVTPKHRVVVVGKTSLVTPNSPSQAGASVYNLARRLFSRCSHPGRLVGREEERSEILSFVDTRVQSSTGGCLYVSGPPGTGKSALISEVTQNYATAKQSVVNCMSVRNTKDLSQKLVEDLDLVGVSKADDLGRCFMGSNSQAGVYLVILDEVDRLVDLDLDLLYRLFEWSMSPQSRLVLIGIANALDLTDRFLPRLKSRSLKPELLPFMPYSALQIAEVLTSKLKSLCTETDQKLLPFIHPAAIQFCARKVAAQTGDLRKAFDICKRAIDLVEHETREAAFEQALQASPSKTPLVENINLSSPITPRPTPTKSRSTTPLLTLETAPKVTIAHMAKVTAQAFSNGTTQRLQTLNIQQKAVLCSLAALEKSRRQTQITRDIYSTPSKSQTNHTAPTIKNLFETYSAICKRDSILHPLTSIEFRDVVSGLESLGLISHADGRKGSLVGSPATPSRTPGKKGRAVLFGGTAAGNDEKRVASVVGFEELSGSLGGAGADLLREILESDGLMM